MRVVLADDEKAARDRLRTLLKRMEGVDVIGEAEDGEEALDLCARLNPDAIFLDIRMPGLSGLDAADLLSERKIPVVFVSAYDEHALEAFQVAAVDYLTKPVRPSRLADTIERLRTRKTPDTALANKLAIPQGDGMRRIERESILYATVTAGGLLELYCESGVFNLTWTLKQLEEKLAGDERFLKISRQVLINFDHLKNLEPKQAGTSQVTLTNNIALEASRTATRLLKERMA